MIRKLLQRQAYAAVLALAAWTLTGCAGDGPPPGDEPPPSGAASFDTIQRTIFNRNCLSAGCHNASDRANNLVLEEGQAYENLVNVAPFNQAARANGLLRVVPNDPDTSFLLAKLTNPGNAEGGRMPLAAAALSPADIDLVRAWILAGAPASSLPSPTASATPSVTDTPTCTPTASATASPTITPTQTVSATPTISPTGTRPATLTPTVSPTPTLSPTRTLTPSASATPSDTATASPIPTPTFSLASTFPQIQATIFNATCLDLGCHSAASAAGGQVLESGQAYASLVGVTPTNEAAANAGFLRVDPGHAANSFLLTKLTLSQAFDPQFFSRMPLSKPPLDPQLIEQIRAWVLRGALPDETP